MFLLPALERCCRGRGATRERESLHLLVPLADHRFSDPQIQFRYLTTNFSRGFVGSAMMTIGSRIQSKLNSHSLVNNGSSSLE